MAATIAGDGWGIVIRNSTTPTLSEEHSDAGSKLRAAQGFISLRWPWDADQKPGYAFVPADRVAIAAERLARGITCVLATQLKGSDGNTASRVDKTRADPKPLRGLQLLLPEMLLEPLNAEFLLIHSSLATAVANIAVIGRASAGGRYRAGCYLPSPAEFAGARDLWPASAIATGCSISGDHDHDLAVVTELHEVLLPVGVTCALSFARQQAVRGSTAGR